MLPFRDPGSIGHHSVRDSLGCMLRFEDGLAIEVTSLIDAPASDVWQMITDINLSARFSSEFLGAEWIDDGPALGATFRGRNQRGEYSWETTSWVTSCEERSTFGWAVSDPDNPGSTWTFNLSADGGGTQLTFHRMLGPGWSGITAMIAREPDREHEILERRNDEHRISM